jgi:hypothetical protein
MAQAIHKMGGDSVVTNTEAVLFMDGTEQITAFTSPISGLQTSDSSYTVTAADVAFVNASPDKFAIATFTMVWPTPFPDTNYSVQAVVEVKSSQNSPGNYSMNSINTKTAQNVGVALDFFAIVAGDIIILHAWAMPYASALVAKPYTSIIAG